MADATTELLIRARGLLERGWCRFDKAQEKDGNPVAPRDPQAVAWCAWGAVIAANADHLSLGFPEAFTRLSVAMDGGAIGSFNIRQESVEPVLAAFDRAIAAPIAMTGPA